MDQAQVVKVMQDAIYTVITVAAPAMIVGLIIGIIISIFQATTQINEQSLGFVPKIIGILLALVAFAGFMLTNLTDFTHRMFDYIGTVMK